MLHCEMQYSKLLYIQQYYSHIQKPSSVIFFLISHCSPSKKIEFYHKNLPYDHDSNDQE